jgi:hypothetical protein
MPGKNEAKSGEPGLPGGRSGEASVSATPLEENRSGEGWRTLFFRRATESRHLMGATSTLARRSCFGKDQEARSDRWGIWRVKPIDFASRSGENEARMGGNRRSIGLRIVGTADKMD